MSNSVSNVRLKTQQNMNLPCVNEAKLKARLIAKPTLGQSPNALKFSGPTAAQRRKVILCCFARVLLY